MVTKIKIFKQGNNSVRGFPEVKIDYGVPAGARGIDMLLKKVKGLEYESEVSMCERDEVSVPMLKKSLGDCVIALVTDGGLVPKGNPDNLHPVNSGKFCTYSLCGKDRLEPDEYEVSHQGYDARLVSEDPNRLLPVDVLRGAEKERLLGKLWDIFYTTAGVMTSIENGTMFGEKIAVSLKESAVDGVILTSSCGTSTRCGALIAKEIEKSGIPVVQVTNLTRIAEVAGAHRILKGNDVCCVFGNPKLSKEEEYKHRKKLALKALDLLAARAEDNKTVIWN